MSRPLRTTIGRRLPHAVALATLSAVAIAAVAIAAELVTAEVQGTVNQVAVVQGGTTSFTIRVKATGSIRCTATPENPATARVETFYYVSSAGSVGGSDLSTPLAFFAGPPSSGVCNVTWATDPAQMSVTANVTAAPDAPLGDHTYRLRTSLFTPSGSGATLRDDTATLITFTVAEGSDGTPPTVDCDGPNGTHGDGGWYVSAAWYDCTATDSQSGLADASDSSFALSTSGEGSLSTSSRTVADGAGNSTTAGPFGPYDVDLHDPDVTIVSPADGADYLLGSPLFADFSCTDTAEGSGVASCEGSAGDGATLDTSSVGERTFTVDARDSAGRETTVMSTYRVVYAFGGLQIPPRGGGAGAVSAGSTLPVWWSLQGVSDHESFVWARSKQAACDAAPAADATEDVDTPGGTGLTYDSQSDRFRLLWQTDGAWAGTCRQLQLKLADGTVHAANFSFR